MISDTIESAHRRTAAAAAAAPGPATVTLGAAVLLGVAGNALLRGGPPGLGFGLWIAAIVLAVELLSRRRAVEWTTEQRLLAVPALLFGVALAWRDSEFIGVLNIFAAAIAFALLSFSFASAGQWRTTQATVRDFILACVRAGLNAAGSAAPLALDAAREGAARPVARASRTAAVLRGLLVAAPLLIAFGALLMAADAMFDRMVRDTLRVDLETAFSHLVVSAVLAWIVAGWLRATLLPPSSVRSTGAWNGPTLGIVEIGVALGALNLLFLAFVAVQLRYLFGGASLVQVTAGLTYAEYARRGFFELVVVTALVLPLLLATHALLRRDRPRDEHAWRALAGATLVLLAIIVASALERMRLYVSAYGLTEDRLYALAFMGWLAVVFVWMGATVLRGRAGRFAVGALAAGWATIAMLNVLNPDALVARVNLARDDAATRVDGRYLGSLSADAVPVVMPAFASLPADARCSVASTVLRRHVDEPARDWRSWNRSRARAERIARAHEAPLRSVAAECAAASAAARTGSAGVAPAPSAQPPAAAVAPAETKSDAGALTPRSRD